MALLAPVIRMWHRRHPEVSITVRETAVLDELLSFVDSSEVDLALAPLPVPDRYTTSVLADEEIVLAAASNHPLARQRAVHMQDLEGARIVHFAPENGLSGWLDRSLAKAGIHTETVMRTAVSAAAPQLAAAGLGIAICPVSAVSVGFPGAVRSFSPRWVRQLGAVTPAAPDPLTARFISDLQTRGVHVSSDVRVQLTGRKSTVGKRATSSQRYSRLGKS